uniref:Uncharacterized protein n=1 Tax=Cannabis sativa TaxID=3483 RepID=A0A803QHP9_CANSA
MGKRLKLVANRLMKPIIKNMRRTLTTMEKRRRTTVRSKMGIIKMDITMNKTLSGSNVRLNDVEEDSKENALEEPIDKEKMENPANTKPCALEKDKGKRKVGEPLAKNTPIPPRNNMATDAFGLGHPSALRGRFVQNNRPDTQVQRPTIKGIEKLP